MKGGVCTETKEMGERGCRLGLSAESWVLSAEFFGGHTKEE